MNSKIFIILLLLICHKTYAQTNVKDSLINAPLVCISYAYQLPGADLITRFGNNHNVGSMFLFKNKRNFIFSADWNFVFGKKIEEPFLLQNLYNSTGIIPDKTGSPTELQLYQRGWHSHLSAGYLLSVLAPNKNSGIFATLGLGVLSHKISIDPVKDKTPQLTNDLVKGYDRLSFGLSSKFFLGYLFLDNKRLINFFAGVEFIQGYTKSLRKYNYDTQQADLKRRLDLLTGARIGVILPLYKRMPKDFYYN